jgi:hypothetical protein
MSTNDHREVLYSFLDQYKWNKLDEYTIHLAFDGFVMKSKAYDKLLKLVKNACGKIVDICYDDSCNKTFYIIKLW